MLYAGFVILDLTFLCLCSNKVPLSQNIIEVSFLTEHRFINFTFQEKKSIEKTESLTERNAVGVLCSIYIFGGPGGLMVSALNSGSSGPGSRPSRGHCVVFMGKTLNSHSASLHPGV